MRQIPLSIFNRVPKQPQPVIPETAVPEVKETTAAEPVTAVEEKQETETTVTETVQEETIKEEPKPTEETVETEMVSEQEKEPATSLSEDTKEKIKTLVAEEGKEEKPKRKRATKKAEENADVASASMKMTGTTKLSDAVAIVCPEYEDETFDEFMEHMNEAMMHTVFDERADSGVIKSIMSNLSRCYDNATRKYAEVSTNLETVSNKSYGLIMRQVAANSVGGNEAERKRAGLHAPEVYKAAGGKTVNLYAVEAGLRKQVTELQTIIRQIEFRKSAIVTYLTAEKMDSNA